MSERALRKLTRGSASDLIRRGRPALEADGRQPTTAPQPIPARPPKRSRSPLDGGGFASVVLEQDASGSAKIKLYGEVYRVTVERTNEDGFLVTSHVVHDARRREVAGGYACSFTDAVRDLERKRAP